jgi:hypothetical protein
MAESNVSERLEQIKSVLGTKPDHELAQEAGTQASVVVRYRRSLGIPAAAGVTASGSAPKRRGRKPGRRPKAASTGPGRKASGRGGKRGPRSSKLDAHRAVIGKIPDRDVAAKAGMSIGGVRLYRKRNKIELEPGARLKRGRKPKSATSDTPMPRRAEVKRASARTPAPNGPRRRISKLDPYINMLGKVSDAEVAAKAGVTPANVSAYRKRHNIPAARKQDGGTTAPSTKRGRGRPPGPARRESTRLRSAGGGQQGYSINVLVGTTTHEYLVIAADISSAADQAQATIRGRHPNGEITAIRHLGAALG